MFKFKVGDEVIIRSGRDKGKKGKVERVLLSKNQIQVSGVNVYKKHKKVTRTQKAGIYEIIKPVRTSNVAIICPKCGKSTKVAFQTDGKVKNRICRNCKGVLK